MVTFENHVGRLVEIRTFPPFARNEFDEHGRLEKILRSHATPIVLCVDLRQATVLSPERAAQVGAAMRAPHGTVLREAILVAPDASIVKMQFERLAREAGGGERSVFDAPNELLAYLGEVLTAGERIRLATFLGATRRAHT